MVYGFRVLGLKKVDGSDRGKLGMGSTSVRSTTFQTRNGVMDI